MGHAVATIDDSRELGYLDSTVDDAATKYLGWKFLGR
jgi:hypothetical protein